MGLSIHYSGSFKKKASLEAMIEEVKDIAEIYKWEYNISATCFPKNTFGKAAYDGKLYGISFTPPNSETISLTFLSNGKMCCGARLKFFGNSDNENDKMYLNTLSSKTQYAGSTVHKIVIHLLKYLSQKYFQDFQLIDEGDYWETGDEKLLEKNFKTYNDLIDGIAHSINNYPINSAESFPDYFERILKILNEKRNKK
ncbi:MAG: hypothetical protein K0B10_05100 [Vicingaceae bacterium]|nr:hypothetical protein [Vicingaceae bacterium]